MSEAVATALKQSAEEFRKSAITFWKKVPADNQSLALFIVGQTTANILDALGDTLVGEKQESSLAKLATQQTDIARYNNALRKAAATDWDEYNRLAQLGWQGYSEVDGDGGANGSSSEPPGEE